MIKKKKRNKKLKKILKISLIILVVLIIGYVLFRYNILQTTFDGNGLNLGEGVTFEPEYN